MINQIDVNVKDIQTHIKDHLESIAERSHFRGHNDATGRGLEASPSINTNGHAIEDLLFNRNTPTPSNNITRQGSNAGREANDNDNRNDRATEVKLYVWMDSNGNNIEPEKFWKEGTQYQTTYKIRDVQHENWMHTDRLRNKRPRRI